MINLDNLEAIAAILDKLETVAQREEDDSPILPAVEQAIRAVSDLLSLANFVVHG